MDVIRVNPAVTAETGTEARDTLRCTSALERVSTIRRSLLEFP